MTTAESLWEPRPFLCPGAGFAPTLANRCRTCGWQPTDAVRFYQVPKHTVERVVNPRTGAASYHFHEEVVT